MERVTLCLFLVGLAVGCTPPRTECDDLVYEAREVLTDCGIDLGDYKGGWPSECTETAIAFEECNLECYKAAPCGALIGKDQAGYQAYLECRGQCIADLP